MLSDLTHTTNSWHHNMYWMIELMNDW
jgi:hypothetical protein